MTNLGFLNKGGGLIRNWTDKQCTLKKVNLFYRKVLLREAPFPFGRHKSEPSNYVLLLLLLHFIIDFCEEDLRVGTAQMPDGKTSTKFRRSKEENRLSLNKT